MNNKQMTNQEALDMHTQKIISEAKEKYGENCSVSIVHGKYVINTGTTVPAYDWELDKKSYASIAYNSSDGDEEGNHYYDWVVDNDRWGEKTDHELVPEFEALMEERVWEVRKSLHECIKQDPQGVIATEYKTAYPNDEIGVLNDEIVRDTAESLTHEQRLARYHYAW